MCVNVHMHVNKTYIISTYKHKRFAYFESNVLRKQCSSKAMFFESNVLRKQCSSKAMFFESNVPCMFSKKFLLRCMSLLIKLSEALPLFFVYAGDFYRAHACTCLHTDSLTYIHTLQQIAPCTTTERQHQSANWPLLEDLCVLPLKEPQVLKESTSCHQGVQDKHLSLCTSPLAL